MIKRIIMMMRREIAREQKLERSYKNRLLSVSGFEKLSLKYIKARGKKYYYFRIGKSGMDELPDAVRAEAMDAIPNEASRERFLAGKWVYLRLDNSNIIFKIKEAKLISESLKQIETNVKLLKTCVFKLKSPDIGRLKVPKAYMHDEYLEDNFKHTRAALEWKAQMTIIKNKRPVKYPENLIHEANDGTMLRSKSEVIIYNILLELNLIFMYEVPIQIGDITICPDFVIYDEINNRIIILEHLGMLNDDRYIEMTSWKLKAYHKAGYILGRNLIITCDDNGTIKSSEIKKLIQERLELVA